MSSSTTKETVVFDTKGTTSNKEKIVVYEGKDSVGNYEWGTVNLSSIIENIKRKTGTGTKNLLIKGIKVFVTTKFKEYIEHPDRLNKLIHLFIDRIF